MEKLFRSIDTCLINDSPNVQADIESNQHLTSIYTTPPFGEKTNYTFSCRGHDTEVSGRGWTCVILTCLVHVVVWLLVACGPGSCVNTVIINVTFTAWLILSRDCSVYTIAGTSEWCSAIWIELHSIVHVSSIKGR